MKEPPTARQWKRAYCTVCGTRIAPNTATLDPTICGPCWNDHQVGQIVRDSGSSTENEREWRVLSHPDHKTFNCPHHGPSVPFAFWTPTGERYERCARCFGEWMLETFPEAAERTRDPSFSVGGG